MVMKFESLIKPKTNLLSLHSFASDFRQVKEPLQVRGNATYSTGFGTQGLCEAIWAQCLGYG